MRVGIFGAGNLGMALADYPGFRREGFVIVGLFDSSKAKIGQQSRGGVRIFDIADFRKMAKRENIDIAVIAVPAGAAQSVVNEAVSHGVRAVLNFSPGSLRVPDGVKLRNMDVIVSMASLSFFLAQVDTDV